MKKMTQKWTAMALVLCLCAGMLGTAALADTEQSPGTATVESRPGGEGTEQLDVTITVSTTEENGEIITETTAQTADGGVLTDSGLQVTYQSDSTAVTDPAPAEDSAPGQESQPKTRQESSSYTVTDPDSDYSASGGSESRTETVESAGEIVVDLIQNGEAAEGPSGTSAPTNSVTTPTNEGDQLKEENPAEYDQTTVETTGRSAAAEITDVIVTSGDPVFVDENGDPIEATAGDGYEWTHYKNLGNADGGSWYAVSTDENGQPVERFVDSGTVAHRSVTDGEGTIIDGLYCADITINRIFPWVGYRMVNVEDAAEEGYYTEEEAAHLRTILLNGYSWEGDEQLARLKTDLLAAQAAGAPELAGMDIANLSARDAATATGSAVWHYGNRFELAANETLVLKGLDPDVEKLYQYLISLEPTTEETGTEVINEEKFVDDLSLTVGGKAENNANNQDNNSSNDVYEATLKFSLVVTPSKENDDLIVKVLDAQGNVVKAARIAGEQKEGETFGYAKEVTENDKTFYVLENMHLAENTNTTFNLKLEGSQLLKEGVYVFESEHYSPEEAIERCVAAPEAGQKWVDRYTPVFGGEEALAEYVSRSQNFIGRYSGTAEVDVSMQIDLTFHVEEATVTTERIWREEDYGGGDVIITEITEEQPPLIGEVTHTDQGQSDGQLHEVDGAVVELPDEEPPLSELPEMPVPLSDVPVTGDSSSWLLIVFVLSGLALAGLTVRSRRMADEP